MLTAIQKEIRAMPEGDTVFLAGTRLRRALSGEVLTRTDFRLPRYSTTDLAGRRVHDVHPRGKHLLFRIEGGITLHTHFLMQGSWHLYKPGARWRGPAHEVRVVLETAPWTAVGFRLPVIDLVPTDEEDALVGHLGPDPLNETWDEAEAIRRIGELPDRAIGEALLDQTAIAGLGNVYKSETCFLRGVHPETPVGVVQDLAGLVRLAARMLRANRTTGNQITTGIDRPGRRRWVYGRGGESCRRCGTPIRRSGGAVGEERVTYWCPICQPSPSGT
jgi:endonuclease-8